MGKIRDFFRARSIKVLFAVYMFICMLSAVLLSLILSNICQAVQARIYEKYKNGYQYRAAINLYEDSKGRANGELYYDTEDITSSAFTPFDDTVYNILGFFSFAFYPICFVVCMGVTSILFYKKQIQKPLGILDHAADNIANDNLDFKIVYDKRDELGKLCSSFEKMRVALQDNHMEMWRQIEERKRLHTALAHDLRTPLTVLKGQSEMLVRYVPQMPKEKVISTAMMMQRHIMRLEAYVDMMNDLQRLEDIEVNRKVVSMSDVTEQMYATGVSVCEGKKFVINTSHSAMGEARLDPAIVMRVYENLLSNAIRFARAVITVFIEAEESYVRFTVSDDGGGFTEKDLSNAAKPFYKAASETDHEHFGMGLNICKVLCEKHGGWLTLSNNNGAFVTAVLKQ